MKRYWEIDVLRGSAIIAMIIFHTVYILSFLGFVDFDLHSGFWWVFPRCIAGTFLLVVGISLTLSYNRIKQTQSKIKIIQKYLLRGLILLFLGLIITLGSFIMLDRERCVLFGILHLIGLSIILAIPLIPLKWINLVAGFLVLVAGFILGMYRFEFFWLLWLGFRPANYYPVDYLPLLPWFSFVLFGIFIGNFVYKENKRVFPLPGIDNFFLIKGLCILGRYSLYIYLAHIPVIYGILLGIKFLYEI
ncbi:MAG: DUF1624 domain-containing protein [Spirochaetales bacterium]|nr:DUF1624 domain-containing protein [Spirochaetales bacterium]